MRRAITTAMKFSVLTLFCLYSLTTFAQVPDYVPTDGLVGWWPFNGNANDESGNGNNGTVNGATLTEDRFGEANKAYSFDGVNDIISTTRISEISGTNMLSASLWFFTDVFSAYDRLIGQEDECNTLTQGFSIAYSFENQTIRVLLRNGSNTFCSFSNAIVPTNQWNNLIVLYNGAEEIDINRCNVYLNGEAIILNFVGPIPSSLDVSNVNTSFEVGATTCNGSLDYIFDGHIDDIGIWSRALSECEIEALYLAQANSLGCTQVEACNYNPCAIIDNGGCAYAQEFYDCNGECINDFNENGICDELEVPGCTYPTASNYNPNATDDDGSCNFSCPGDLNNDEIINTSDLLLFLSYFGQTCQ
jgi:hypothetical protein